MYAERTTEYLLCGLHFRLGSKAVLAVRSAANSVLQRMVEANEISIHYGLERSFVLLTYCINSTGAPLTSIKATMTPSLGLLG